MREPKVFIAVGGDDLSVGEGLESLVRSAGWRVESFRSAQEFLARPRTEVPNCLILDLQLPGLSGLDLQKRMAELDVTGLPSPKSDSSVHFSIVLLRADAVLAEVDVLTPAAAD